MRRFGLLLPFWLALSLGGCRAAIAKGPPDQLLARGKQFLEAKDYRRAEPQFRGVQQRHPESDEAEEAQFLLAETRRHRRKGQTAFESYKKFVERYPNSRFSVGAAVGEYRLGMDHLEGRIPGFLFFKSPRSYGVRILAHMQIHFRNHSLADDALVKVANWHLKKKEYEQAAVVLRRLLSEYPRSPNMLWARYQFGRTLWLQNQGALYDERLLRQSRRAFEDFIGTARLTGQAQRLAKRVDAAQRMIKRIDDRIARKGYETGRFYERRRHPSSAVYYYEHVRKSYPGSKYATESEKRLKKLGVKTG
jgi:outer membrane protein assembly factor BamD (BamD/ComL family)